MQAWEGGRESETSLVTSNPNNNTTNEWKQLTLACRLGKEGRESETSLQRKGSDYIVVSCLRVGHQYEVKKRRKKREKKKTSLTSLESAVLTFTSGTSDEFWEVETDLKRKSLTRAANQGKPLRVLKADVEGNLALGGGDHVRVGKAHLKLQVVLGVVAKTISGRKSVTKNFEN